MTLNETFAARKARTLDLLDQVRAAVEKLDVEHKDWGHVGTISHAETKLAELLESL